MFDSLGPTLRVFREIAGCSQAELAGKAQIGKSQLSKYENGKALPRLDSLGRILGALGTTPLVMFYVISVLDKTPAPPAGLRAELLHQGAGSLLSGRKPLQFLELFDRFLALYEEAVEARVAEATLRSEGEKEP